VRSLKEIALLESNENDKTLWEDEWIAVKSKDDWYTYTHSVKSDGLGVAVLGYTDDNLILGRYENVPPHGDGIALTSLTGMVEKGDTPLETAVKELKEESGFDSESSDFMDLGVVRPSKSSDTTIHCFAIRLDYKEGNLEGAGDGTKGEEGSYCKFVNFEEAVWSKDALISLMTARLNSKQEE